MDDQLRTDWPLELAKILAHAHPLHRQICRPLALQYYWSASNTEYATDVVVKDAPALAARYPGFVHHAMSSFSSPAVLSLCFAVLNKPANRCCETVAVTAP